MFVSIVLNTEYMDYASRKTWYLKNLLHCKDNGWILITHDYIRKHFDEIQNNILERIFDQMEMRRFTWEEVKDVEQYFIPDEIFDDLERRLGSHTEMLFELNKNVYAPLDDYLRGNFKQIEDNHPGEKVEGILHCLDSFKTLRNIADDYNVPLIHYSFSAIRKTMGYQQTLYQVNCKNNYWNARECESRYGKFKEEQCHELPVFSNEELIAIIGKTHTLPLIQLINTKPKYEMGICCECYSLTPQTFISSPYVDDDIFYECGQLFPKDKIKVRSHAIHLNTIQVDRSEVHNDPASMMLSCKRSTAVQSQIILKTLLWKRTAVMKKDFMAFSFLCEKDYTSENVVDIKGLNYFLICYLIPSGLMFSDEYWKWRLNNPTEAEIYWKHLEFLFKNLGIDKDTVLSLKGKDRFKYLLEARGCDKHLIDNLLSGVIINNINWDVASSQFDIVTPDGTKSYWRIDTENEDGSLTSKLIVDAEGAVGVKFYPLYDVVGFAKLNAVWINGKEIEFDHSMSMFKYMPKNKGSFELPISNQNDSHLAIECNWEYKKVNDYLSSII